MSLLLEEGDDRVPEPEIVRSPEQLIAAARPGEGHVEDPSDRRRGTVGHHDDPIGELKGFVHVVGDHHDGFALGLPERDQLILQIHPRQRIEERKRLVEQQEPRLEREGPRDAGALLHPRRQLARVAPALPAEPHRRQIGLDVAIGRGRNPVASELDVVAHRHPWQERRRLKDHAAIGARAVDLTPADDDTPGARRREAHQDREHGRLAAAGMAKQADELALVDVQREVAHDDRRARRRLVRLAELRDLDEGFHCIGARGRGSRGWPDPDAAWLRHARSALGASRLRPALKNSTRACLAF